MGMELLAVGVSAIGFCGAASLLTLWLKGEPRNDVPDGSELIHPVYPF